MTKIKLIFATFSLVGLLAAPVFALSVSTGAGTGVHIATGVGVNVSGSASGAASSTTSGNGGSAGAGADLSIPLVVTQADVTAGTNAPVKIAADNVRTKVDLSGFIAAHMKSDANLASVDTASDHVAVTYKEPAKLFGAFAVSMDTTATTDASGNVTVTRPWWAFLASTDTASLQTNVRSGVDTVLGANASANTTLSASQQAQLVSVIETTLAAAANASANASTQ